jgi:hypothetical protein
LWQNEFVYKRESFELARPFFQPRTWSIVDEITKVRRDWNPTKLLNLSQHFYKKIGDMSETVLAELREH